MSKILVSWCFMDMSHILIILDLCYTTLGKKRSLVQFVPKQGDNQELAGVQLRPKWYSDHQKRTNPIQSHGLVQKRVPFYSHSSHSISQILYFVVISTSEISHQCTKDLLLWLMLHRRCRYLHPSPARQRCGKRKQRSWAAPSKSDGLWMTAYEWRSTVFFAIGFLAPQCQKTSKDDGHIRLFCFLYAFVFLAKLWKADRTFKVVSRTRWQFVCSSFNG